MGLSRALDAPATQDRDRVDRDAGRLVGTRCKSCEAVSWPGRAICHRCGSADGEPATLSAEGKVVTYTTVHVPRPGLEPPYILGQVDLPEGVLVFAHLRNLPDGTRVPVPVRIVMAPEADAVPPFWFEPMEAR
jgi:uncharacterized protein